MSSRIPSHELAVKAWFRDYSIGLAFVGIKLGLTATEQSELEHRLLVVCQDLDKGTPSKRRRFRSGSDPIRSRWLEDHAAVQGETWAGV
jgi:hypothetical protein